MRRGKLCQPCVGARRGEGVGFFSVNYSSACHVLVLTRASETLSFTLCNCRVDYITRVNVMHSPLSSRFRTFLDDVSKVLLVAATHATETIVCGDFNTIYKHLTCTDTINLVDLLDTSGFVQHVSSATHERGDILDLIIIAKTFNLLSTYVRPTTLLTDHYVPECVRVFYRKFESIDKRASTADIRNAFTKTSGITVESIDNYNTAIAIMLHTEELSDAKSDLPCAERLWRNTRLIVHIKIYTTLRDEYRRQLAAMKASHLCQFYMRLDAILKQCSASPMQCWADLHQLNYLSNIITQLPLTYYKAFFVGHSNPAWCLRP